MTEAVAGDASRRRHESLTQLDVTHSLRRYLREWFREIRAAVDESGEPFIVAGANTPHEIFEAMDIPYMTDVWYAGLVAARKQSAHYSGLLADLGFHDGLSRYSALAYAVAVEDGGDKPWGGFPKPCLVVCSPATGVGSDLLADHYQVPFFGIERPVETRFNASWWESAHWDWEDLEGSGRIDFMVEQIEELIALTESITGRRLDRDRLREVVDRSNVQQEYFCDVRDMLAGADKLPVRLGEAMSQIMGIQWHRGTDWAVRQAREFRDEVRARVEAKAWVCENETYRLTYIGRGLWQQLDFFADFEASHGAVFVRSNYTSFPCDAYLRYRTLDPVRNLAARYATFNDRLHLPPGPGPWTAHEAQTHRLSGAIQLTADFGQAFITHSLESAGVPVLSLATDAVDARAWDGEQMRERVASFIENRLEPLAVRS